MEKFEQECFKIMMNLYVKQLSDFIDDGFLILSIYQASDAPREFFDRFYQVMNDCRNLRNKLFDDLNDGNK